MLGDPPVSLFRGKCVGWIFKWGKGVWDLKVLASNKERESRYGLFYLSYGAFKLIDILIIYKKLIYKLMIS